MKNLEILAKEGKLETLTFEKAKQLKGKRIQTIYFGYSGQNGVDDFFVGDIVSEYDLAKKDTTSKGYKNRAEYWESYMTKKQIQDTKNTLCLLRKDGSKTYIRSHYIVPLKKQDDFTCSDSDRYVQFRVVEDEN
jgi:hypothetical protein